MGPAPDEIPSPDRDAGSISLLVEPPSGECLQVRVHRSPFVIGRQRECDLTLRDSRISRRHARIRLGGGECSIEDLDSRHGLVVNGRRVQRSALAVGDRISFGIDGSFVLTVGESVPDPVPLLDKLSRVPDDSGRTGPLGRLAAMLDVARSMEASEGVAEVFEAVVDAVRKIASADRAFLLLRDDDGELQVVVARDASGAIGEQGGTPLPRKAIAEALDSRGSLFSMPVIEPGARGALCVPILRLRIGAGEETSVISARKDTLGALYMDASDPAVPLGKGGQALLQALAIEVSTVIDNARLIEGEREKRRLERELEMARGIQEALRPAALPADGWLVAKGYSQSSARLGGDYYDVMQLDDGKWAAVLADVSGKGVAASLLASLLQGAFFLGSGPDVSLAGTLGRINRYICERSGQTRFATVFALVIDESGRMRWSNAGHCPAILVRASGAVEQLAPNSRPVGLFAEQEFSEGTCDLLPGDKLLAYSDGLTEARNPAGEQFGEKRLEEAAAEHARLGTGAFFDALLGAVQGFAGGQRPRDDLTLLALGFRGA